jgi:hypothetical protein
MNKDPKQLAENIITQVFELAALAGVDLKQSPTKSNRKSEKPKETSGATGGMRLLIREEYFDSPRQLPETIERLKQDGRHYSNATISMGLLSLVRERVLTRFRDKGDKNWKYVIRK